MSDLEDPKSLANRLLSIGGQRIADLEDALRECQSALAMMIAPDAIKQTTVINAYATAVAAEAKARSVLENCPAGLADAHQKSLPQEEGVEGIYIASKTTHGERWRDLRASGAPIISTWIDEAEAGATTNWHDLWHRCIREASQATATIVYREEGEVLKGAFVEMGAALAAGRVVFAVGCDEFSVRHHMRVVTCVSLDEALELAREHIAALSTLGGRKETGL